MSRLVQQCLFPFELASGIIPMQSSTNFQAFPLSEVFHCLCDNGYHKQGVLFLLYLLGENVTRQYNPNPLD